MDCVSWFQFLSQTCHFGVGFLVFGCFKQLFHLICIICFINLGIKVFQFGFHYKGLSKFLLRFSGKSGSNLKKDVRIKDESDGWGDRELSNVDEVSDVMSLREILKRESRRANDAYVELDRERVASATAANEAMSMIRRLQKEKSLIDMELNQYRRLVEEKQSHDQEVIQSLKWLVRRHESERNSMDDQLNFYKKKLKVLGKGGDGDVLEENDESISLTNSSLGEGSPCHELITANDYHSSPRDSFKNKQMTEPQQERAKV